MSLITGTHLGPYEIQSAIGSGGPPSLARTSSSASYGEAAPKPI